MDEGFIGAYVLPADDADEPRPAALVLGGSEGGLESATMTARWIAGLGYPALAVAYFDEKGLPKQLQNVPVEPVLTGLEWLHAQARGRHRRALHLRRLARRRNRALARGEHPELVAGAFAPVGSGYLVCGVPDLSVPAWTLGGEPLSPDCARDIGSVPPAESWIDVAAIDGPVVLACGSEDALWPSCYFMDDIVERRGGGADDRGAGDGASHDRRPAAGDARARPRRSPSRSTRRRKRCAEHSGMPRPRCSPAATVASLRRIR